MVYIENAASSTCWCRRLLLGGSEGLSNVTGITTKSVPSQLIGRRLCRYDMQDSRRYVSRRVGMTMSQCHNIALIDDVIRSRLALTRLNHEAGGVSISMQRYRGLENRTCIYASFDCLNLNMFDLHLLILPYPLRQTQFSLNPTKQPRGRRMVHGFAFFSPPERLRTGCNTLADS